MMRWLYSMLFYLVMPLVVLRLLWRARKNPAYAQRWGERFGKICPNLSNHSIWWHTVSVGETLAAMPLIKALQKAHPDIPILVTTMTPTGSAQVQRQLGNTVQHQYLPYDLPHMMCRFISKVRPRILIIMETELWPNLLYYCQKQKIPVLLTNARLSKKSAQGYAKFSALTRPMLGALTRITAQTEADAQRFMQLGVCAENLVVTGSVKWDVQADANLLPVAENLRAAWGKSRLVWIAASTHPPEEKFIIEAHAIIRNFYPDSLLIWAPRHPERATEIQQQCKNFGWQVVTRQSKILPNLSTQVFLVDTLGELPLFYASADVVFVGGSLYPKGGHNLLEAAVWGKPLISGEHVFNFAEIANKLTQAHALILVHDVITLAAQVKTLFENTELRQHMGDAAYQQIAMNKGAMAKQFALIETLIADKT